MSGIITVENLGKKYALHLRAPYICLSCTDYFSVDIMHDRDETI